MADPEYPRFVDSIAEAVLQELKAKKERGELARGVITSEILRLAEYRKIPPSALWERWSELNPDFDWKAMIA
jgi:hypothetical protein